MSKKETTLTLGISESEKVDEFMANLKYPLLDLTQHLRKFILSIDSRIGEGVYWNAPTFYFTGEMQPFNPKEYKRYLVGFNFYRKDEIRLVFLKGATVPDPTGLLQGDYKDGRRIASFTSINDFESKKNALKRIIEQLVDLMK